MREGGHPGRLGESGVPITYTGDVDDEAIRTAVGELQTLVRGDGAELVLEEADARTARIGLRLDLSAVGCEDCVLPPELLRDMVTASLQRRLAGEFELVLADPRVSADG